MVAPDDHGLDVADGLAGLGGQLGEGAVVVEAEHGGEVAGIEVGGALHRDVGVGVGGVADHEHLDVALGHLVEGLALGGEDGGVGLEEVLALHALAAGTRADQEGDVRILEGHFGIVSADHSGEEREGAVLELHHHALEGSLGLGQVEELKDDRLVLAEHLTAGDAEEQAVADLSGSTGNGNDLRGFHR
ncbi:hypothetical protein D3C86_553570 [compost metagenome]